MRVRLSTRGVLRHAVWIELAARDAQGELVQMCSLRDQALDGRAEHALPQDVDELESRTQRLALQETGAALEEGVVGLDRGAELRDAFALRGDGLHDGDVVILRRQLEHLAEIAHGAIRTLPIGLVDAEQVGDFQDARLDRLDVVAQAGHHHHHGGVSQAADLHLVLADTHRLDDDDVLAHRVEDADAVAGGARQPAELTARRQGSNEHSRVERVILHADAVAEDRASRERTGRVDRHHADGLPQAADVRDQPVYQRALSRAGIAGDSDELGTAGAGEQGAQLRLGGGLDIVDEAHQTRGGPDIALQHAVRERAHQALSKSRAITSRWISLVPSPIVHSFTSR